MGGRPALGAMVLPGMTAAARGALQPTASPAAREILRNRASAETTPPWQPRPRPSGLADSTPSAGPEPATPVSGAPVTPASVPCVCSTRSNLQHADYSTLHMAEAGVVVDSSWSKRVAQVR